MEQLYNICCGKIYYKKNLKIKYNIFKLYTRHICCKKELCENCLNKKTKLVFNYHLHNNINDFKGAIDYYFQNRFKFLDLNTLIRLGSPIIEIALREYVTELYFNDDMDDGHIKWINHLNRMSFIEQNKYSNNFWFDIIYQIIVNENFVYKYQISSYLNLIIKSNSNSNLINEKKYNAYKENINEKRYYMDIDDVESHNGYYDYCDQYYHNINHNNLIDVLNLEPSKLKKKWHW